MMQPYYEQDGIAIYNADCMDVLPSLSVDIAFTSPPYNTIAPTKPSGMMKEHRRKQNEGYDGYSDDMPEDEYQRWIASIVQGCLDVSDGLVWVNHKTRYRDRIGINPVSFLPGGIYCEVIWNRRGSITLNARKFAPSHEYIFGLGVPHYWDNSSNTRMSVWDDILPERNVPGHPCPFPVALASRCIVASCPVGGLVLDPLMGSGTTLVAAQLEGRKATGIEINERYCEIAAKRLEQKVLF